MSAVPKSADPAELAFSVDNVSNSNGSSNNNNNSRGNSSRATSQGNNNTPKKYIAPGAASSIKMCPASNSSRPSHNNNNNTNSKQLNGICQQAQAGHKLMVIMRGPPGSGKSTLAESLLRQSRLLERHGVQDFVFGTDDYFKSRNGYDFNPTLLPAAHEWNQKRVREKAARGWSPIFVDNTNTMVWEMQPYVQIGVKYGYVLELLEPQTSWCKSASKLAQKNVHQVPRENIQRMLERYERTSAAELIRLLKETKYTVALPQLRQYPPLPAVPVVKNFDQKEPPDALIPPQPVTNIKLNANAQTWVPYEQGAPSYWSQTAELPDPEGSTIPASGLSEKSLIDLLRDNCIVEEVAEEAKPKTETCEAFQRRHCLDCPNEPGGFAILRQMYPNKQMSGLWDLFVKCNADVDWAVDILIKEDELNGESGADHIASEKGLSPEEALQFQCDCANPESPAAATPRSSSPSSAAAKPLPKPQRQVRNKRASGPTNKELQLQIENCFVLGDEQYSEHTRKIRDIRNGILDQPALPEALEVAGVEQEDPEEEVDPEDNTLLEMDLGSMFIERLRDQFDTDDEVAPLEQELPAATKIFMPRQLAKQLYMLWKEAVYNQLEEQRQQTLRDDEQFARLLKHPEYAECSESPSNVGELLDMELAWSIYNSEQLAAKQAAELAARKQPPNDIATHLTKMKLCETFPEIPNDTVLETFMATGSNYSRTVEVLGGNVQSSLSGAELYEQALREGEKLSAQVALEQQKMQQKRLQQSSSGQRSSSQSSAGRSPLLHEEAKCAALRDFEETRNLAAHHSQLKAECYLKAKQAVQRGNGNVALYYSEIANLHKQKIDSFNQRAANCIMEVHRHTQNNPDLLDLHYLHTVEAISCLDLFLDRHITVLRNCTRVYKHVFIITGRGLHSANGVSTIKNRVKSRLAERRLRWQEVNPGLLRVKIFSASRHSKNF
ncbi:uncharacterized protein LOC110179811 [Drosophila serrata]|uniref:uncharacterized protein LOC110179811 n=1 Tax=Drosophila serrata TaxID=7274 RepID=UPI000A1D2908|nr:uncharacterized protein LOC110179811 [Drosophila serrata]